MVIGLARFGARSGSGLQWLLHFSEWQHSGVSLHAFCRSRRLSYRAARAWQLKLARTVLGRRNPAKSRTPIKSLSEFAHRGRSRATFRLSNPRSG